MNGGQNSLNNPTKYTVEQEITLSNPIKDGYVFDGWKDNNTKITKLEKGSTENKVLTAQWKTIDFSITYELAGGTNNTNNPSNYNVEQEITFLNPTKKGYKFLGWKDENDNIITKIDKGTMKNITLTATWEKTITLYLVGDSTVCSFEGKDLDYYYQRFGYGTKIGEYLKDNITVNNLAISGRSSKSFLIEENYQTLLDNISEGDYLIIGFGHNDEKAEVERYTNPNTGLDDPSSFKYHLYNYYVKVATDNKATPILMTPIVRRSASDNYTGNSIHQTSDSGDYKGGDYSKAIIDLGEEKSILTIDLTTITKNLYTELTATKTVKLHAWTTSKETSVDNTHLNEYGASLIAYKIALALKETTLSNLIKDNIVQPDESILKVNPLYKEPEPQKGFTPSTIWTGLKEGWYGTVFGDVGGDKNINNTQFNLLYQDNKFILRAGIASAAGKIASSSDGIAMIFQEIDKDQNFTLSATMTLISNGTSNTNQIGFGLMVRDDMYTDVKVSLSSNYISSAIIDPSNPTLFYGRNESALQKDSTITLDNNTINLSIVKENDTYIITIGNNTKTISNVDLNKVNANNNYVGFFVSRQVEVEFSNLIFELK